MITRRHLLATALATGAAVPLGIAGPGRAAPARLTLPRPTGPHRVGTVSLHLVDRSRPDPVAGPGRPLELMAGVWYPAARDIRRHPVAPWMPDASWRALIESVGFDPGVAAAPLTAGHEGAAVLPGSGRLPVVMYSHGNNTCRAETTIVVQELASHGYVVVTVDTPYDGFTEFPDGRLVVSADDLPLTPWDHARDVQFVLDRLEEIAAGRNPDAGGRPLPAGLGAALELRRVGMFGWSKAATATALVMNVDRRVRAGIGFDGEMQSQPPVAELDRPFLLMSAEFTRTSEPSVAQFWSLLRGWRLNLRAKGAAHGSYNDQQWLIPQLARLTGMSGEELTGWVGTLDPARAVRIQQAYPLAFFDLHLRHRPQRLLAGPSPAFPEVCHLD
ncbi:acetylhydrolase [Actinoplanes sp. NPDC024001]|uniref:alpha/beta hydrolase family protein n=1 Tax=Actinoplanes sp. NPDC024001 TaxID=3154598 RepID=UPI0033D3617E